VYVPPHQRLRSVITVPSAVANGSPSPARDSNYQSPFSSPNPNFEGRVSPAPYSSPKQQQHNHGGHFQFSQQRNGSPRSNNHHHYQQNKQQWKGSFQYSYHQQQSNYWPSSVVDEFSEEGSDREFGEFEPSAYPAGVSILHFLLAFWVFFVICFFEMVNRGRQADNLVTLVY